MKNYFITTGEIRALSPHSETVNYFLLERNIIVMFFLFSNFLTNYPAVSHCFIHGLTSNIFATNTQEIGIVTQNIFIPYVSVSVLAGDHMTVHA